jgi:predicted SAM-dependent methyltransferase
MTIADRLRNSHKLKVAAGLAARAFSWPVPLYRRMLLGRRLRERPVLRIHLGCGQVADPRFLNVDARPFPHVQYVTGSMLMPALPPGCADMIYACHLFEHEPFGTQMDVLRRWHKLLKPGGEIRLAVPDFEKVVDLYQRKEINFPSVQSILMGGQTYPNNFHYALFTTFRLTRLLRDAGFTEIRPWSPRDEENWPQDWSWAEHLSLNLRAQKP